jgi:hypothetical protein
VTRDPAADPARNPRPAPNVRCALGPMQASGQFAAACGWKGNRTYLDPLLTGPQRLRVLTLMPCPDCRGRVELIP